MSGWSCPHQTGNYFCQRVKRECEPGMKGCVLRGKVRFANEEDEKTGTLEPPPKFRRKKGVPRRKKRRGPL
jgi:hypothetical protein